MSEEKMETKEPQELPLEERVQFLTMQVGMLMQVVQLQSQRLDEVEQFIQGLIENLLPHLEEEPQAEGPEVKGE